MRRHSAHPGRKRQSAWRSRRHRPGRRDRQPASRRRRNSHRLAFRYLVAITSEGIAVMRERFLAASAAMILALSPQPGLAWFHGGGGYHGIEGGGGFHGWGSGG